MTQELLVFSLNWYHLETPILLLIVFENYLINIIKQIMGGWETNFKTPLIF
jgi:hypothetical protein